MLDFMAFFDTLNLSKLFTQIICEPDRKIAITKAIQELEQKEILLILGKGDETYQILGDKSVEFDDREVAREVLKQLALHKA